MTFTPKLWQDRPFSPDPDMARVEAATQHGRARSSSVGASCPAGVVDPVPRGGRLGPQELVAPDGRPGVEDVGDQLRWLGRVPGLAVVLLAQRVGDLARRLMA
jgi:hypothetical protein